jgi:hypothetical protein
MPETKKKPKKPRAKRAVKSKKGLKQKQKQRQQVNVNVSAGGSGGGGYIPIPQAPEINYSLLSQLIRPANTVDVPIRAAAPVPEAPFVRPAEPESLASEIKPKRKYTKKVKVPVEPELKSGEASSKAFTSGLEYGFAKGGTARQDPFMSETESESTGSFKQTRKPRAKKGAGASSATAEVFGQGPIDLRGSSKREAGLLVKYAPEGSEFIINPKKEGRGGGFGDL